MVIKKTRKNSTKKMGLSASDYRKILKFYKLSIPKKVSNLRKKGDKIIAKKFCSCIKKVRAKFKKEGIAIAICTKSVITRKGITRGKFKCKKRRSIKLFKGGSKRRTKKNRRTRKRRGGDGEKGEDCAICSEGKATHQFCERTEITEIKEDEDGNKTERTTHVGGHFFCPKCIAKILETANSSNRRPGCPICRKPYRPPPHLIDNEGMGEWIKHDGFLNLNAQEYDGPGIATYSYGDCCTDCGKTLCGKLCGGKDYCKPCIKNDLGQITGVDESKEECTTGRWRRASWEGGKRRKKNRRTRKKRGGTLTPEQEEKLRKAKERLRKAIKNVKGETVKLQEDDIWKEKVDAEEVKRFFSPITVPTEQKGGRKRSTKKNRRTRKKRGGAPRARRTAPQQHRLSVRATNHMLEYFRNPETQQLIPAADQVCRSEVIKNCLARELINAGVPRDDYGNLSDEDKTKYHRVIEICRPTTIQIPWNTQSGE